MRTRTSSRFRPYVERFENRNLMSTGMGMVGLAGRAQHAALVHGAKHPAAQMVVHTAKARPPHRHHPGCGCDDGGKHHPGLGGGHGPGNFFDCAAKGIYNFAIVTITNVSTSPVNFGVLAKPCPDRFVPETLLPGGTMYFWTHFPSRLPPSFQVNLGGLNSYTPTPNIVPSKMYPQFAYQITVAMGSQYQIVQTSPGVFALQPTS